MDKKMTHDESQQGMLRYSVNHVLGAVAIFVIAIVMNRWMLAVFALMVWVQGWLFTALAAFDCYMEIQEKREDE